MEEHKASLKPNTPNVKARTKPITTVEELMNAVRDGDLDAIVRTDFDVNCKDKVGKNALEYAREEGHSHIIQYLLRESFNDEILNATERINNQLGVIAVMFDFLSNIKVYLVPYLQQCFKDRLPFCDDLLMGVFSKYSPLDKEERNSLLKDIIKVCDEIIQGSNKRDWGYMTEYILKSNLWFDVSRYEQLLAKVQVQQKVIDKKLKDKINTKEMNDLKAFKMDLKLTSNVRQDQAVDGTIAEYKKSFLEQCGSPKLLRFYNNNIYLNKLLLVAGIIDKQFQIDMRKISNDIKHSKNIDLVFKPGPIKTYKRCNIKIETDYNNDKYPWPNAAHLLDINRCMVILTQMSDTQQFLVSFKSMLADNLQYCVKTIVRFKNDWNEFNINSPHYADIKLNVLISLATNELNFGIVGEIQILTKDMSTYKLASHPLYSISRNQDVIRTVTNDATLGEDKTHLFSAVICNERKKIMKYIINKGLTSKALALMEDITGDNVLAVAIKYNNLQSFKLISRLIESDMIKDCLLKGRGMEYFMQLQENYGIECADFISFVCNNYMTIILEYKDDEYPTALYRTAFDGNKLLLHNILSYIKNNSNNSMRQVLGASDRYGITTLMSLCSLGYYAEVQLFIDAYNDDKELLAEIQKTVAMVKKQNEISQQWENDDNNSLAFTLTGKLDKTATKIMECLLKRITKIAGAVKCAQIITEECFMRGNQKVGLIALAKDMKKPMALKLLTQYAQKK